MMALAMAMGTRTQMTQNQQWQDKAPCQGAQIAYKPSSKLFPFGKALFVLLPKQTTTCSLAQRMF